MACILPRASLLWLAILAIPIPAPAQNPPASSATTRLIPYSAVLPDSGPDAPTGARSITFALFDETDGGTLLWSETQVVNVDARGRYSAHLGAVTALPLEIFRTEQARWLEVSVDGKALPRTMLVAVPYALRAADAETLAGRPLSEFVLTDRSGRRVRVDGTAVDDPAVDGTGVPNQLAKWSSPTTLSSSIITESFDNRLGVLAPDPTGGGVVDSRVTIRNPNNNTAFAVLSPTNQRRFALNTNSDGSWTLFDGFLGTWNAGIMQLHGSAGIGGISAFAKFSVFTGASTGDAVLGSTTNSTGVKGVSSSGNGVEGRSTSGTGVRGVCTAGGCLAGEFTGNVSVSGTLTKGGGAFQIDHPLDPVNKYVSHSFVESPDMMNVYNGNATLDASGEAWVTLPEWFEALNRDFRYQLTAIGRQANPYIAEEVAGNRFKIAGGAPSGKVSWQVTGIRQDAWANRNRIPVEHDKPEEERGRYLHPAAFDLPMSRAIPSLLPDASIRERRRPQ